MSRLLIFLPVLLLLLPLSAQEEAGQTRTIRILFLNAPDNAPRTVHLYDGQRSQEVQLPRMNLSPIYQVPAGPLKLRMVATAVEDPELLPAEAPSVEISESIGDAYLFCVSDPANPVVPVRMNVLDAGKEKFRNGQMLWSNLTTHEISGVMGDAELALPPLGTAIVDAPTSESGSYPVDLSYKTKDDQGPKPLCQTRWMHDARSRHLVLVFDEPDRRLPRILGFPDFRPPPKVPAETP